jgi:hypothetical protein
VILGTQVLLQKATFPHSPAFLIAAAAAITSTLVYLPVIVYFNLPTPYVFTLPLAALFYSAVAATSAVLSISGPGVRWKGRVYQPPAP